MPIFTIDQALQYAAGQRTAGLHAEAERICRQVLAQQPGNAEAKNLLGRIAIDVGKLPEAAQLIREAVQAAPNDARYSLSWSVLRRAQGDLGGAVAAARRAVELAPDWAGARNDLGLLLNMVGHKEEAIAELRTAARLQPGYLDVQCNLGLVLGDLGRHEEAVALFEEVLRAKPDSARGHRLLGISLRQLGRFNEAIRALKTALQLQPRDAQAYNELGVALWQNREPAAAMAAWRTAVQLDRNLTAAYHHLGVACLNGNEAEEAVACYRRLLELEPGNAWHHNNLGAALSATGAQEEAFTELRKAMALAPSESSIHSGLICLMQVHPDYDAKMILAECVNWNRLHGEQWMAATAPHENSPEPARRLRVGYVSSNFCTHVIGRNILPLLQHHEHEHWEVYCYADVRVADEMTEEFIRCADHWRNTLGVTDEVLAGMIRADGINILVDLNLHLADDRLPVFARRPAPVQVTFAGYPGTTGLRAIDYRLTDPYLDPPGETDDFYSEESIRLPQSFWCYAPREDVPIHDLPAAATGIVTFGCLNNFSKVNEGVLKLWGRVLQSVPGSRLVMQAPEGSAQKRVREVLGGQGIGPGRLEFLPKGSHREYLEFYHRIDIKLDTFPYHGHTTSLDALWMGVPVIALPGKHALARAGVSHLTNVGLPEFIADSEASFVEKATQLARDLDRLRELRRSLRARMEASPLMDAAGFTRGVEAAYRSMWERWCEATTTPPRR